jgi:hypothetical protein
VIGHRIKAVVHLRGVAGAGAGELECECGWIKAFLNREAVERAHARHVELARVFARRAQIGGVA